MALTNITALIAALIGLGGVFGGIAVFRKVKPETQSIIVTAAQGAVIVQSGIIDDLREELDRAKIEIAQLNKELHEEIERLQRERDSMRAENSRLAAENYGLTQEANKLRERVRELERRVDGLDSGVK